MNPATYDYGSWDWHQWALALIATYLAYRTVRGAVTNVAAGVKSTGRKASKAVAKRKRHVKDAGRNIKGALFG